MENATTYGLTIAAAFFLLGYWPAWRAFLRSTLPKSNQEASFPNIVFAANVVSGFGLLFGTISFASMVLSLVGGQFDWTDKTSYETLISVTTTMSLAAVLVPFCLTVASGLIVLLMILEKRKRSTA